MERRYIRKYPRMRTTFTVRLALNGTTYRERASAIGGGGLFLSLRENPPFDLDAEMTVRFRPAKHLPVMEAKAKVCYVALGEGAAIEFTEINPEHRRMLLQLIHHKTGNKREHARAILAAQIKCDETTSLAFGRDISVGGMFIETSRPIAVGSRLTLRFNLDEREPILVVVAEVSYQVGKLGLGIQFVDVAPEDLKRIENYVAKCNPLPEPKS